MKLFELINEIGIVNQLASTRFERILPNGLTQSQFSVLNNFVRLGGTRSPAQLANAFQVTKGAMTNTLRRLEEKNYVRIRTDPSDGRAKIVEITAAGKNIREKAVRAASKEIGELAELFDDDLVEVVLPRLSKLRQQLDQARNE